MTYSDKNKGDTVYAFPPELLDSLSKKILTPIQRGESAVIKWFPHTGKSIFLKEIFSRNYLRQYFGTAESLYSFIQIDLSLILNDNFTQGLLHYLHCELAERSGVPRKNIINLSEHELYKEIINQCAIMTSKDLHVVFVIDEIESIMRNPPQKLIQIFSNIVFTNRNRIHTIINVCNFDHLPLFALSDKSYTLIQNQINIPLPTNKETKYFLNILANRWHQKLTSMQKETLSFFHCNNLLVKTALRKYERDPKLSLQNILDDREIKQKLKIFYNLLGTTEREVCRKITFHIDQFTPEEEPVVDYFKQLKIIEKVGRKWVFLLPILEHVLNNTNRDLSIRKNVDGELILGSYPLHNILTQNEYKTLTLLFNNKKSLVDRDALAKTIWGSVYLDKYSNWAIDKTISRIRKKLSSLGLNKDTIQIVKGKGYKLQTQSHGTQ